MMQSDKDISSQVPPPIEELDKIMQGSDDDEEDKDKTAPPSPSLVPKESHLPPFQQIPYGHYGYGGISKSTSTRLECTPSQAWRSF